MGIRQLSKLIKEKAPKGISYRKPSFYNSHTIAIDASLAMYQFLIAVRSDGKNLGFGDETTSHLIGMFYRTARMIESGIVPLYVFDGKAPENKTNELQKRNVKREKADEMLKSASGKLEIEKYEKRKVKVNEKHVFECKKLLNLLGVPIVEAPSEAEAYCAYLCKSGFVQAVATEDMDSLTFGSPILLRNMNVSQAKRLDIEEYNLKIILKELDISMELFIDLCILLGCDYCETIKGIGTKRAYELIKKYGKIEQIIENGKVEVGDNFDYLGAREIFAKLSEEGEGTAARIDYDAINMEDVVKYLCDEKGFEKEKVKNTVKRILNTKGKKKQNKLDGFFKRA